ncbi:MAG TPA: substrate-binding domain-containing protein [Phycisphaerae bacterium]|nr:substrate-binding domain-containing protein [Phycisphaerae bacterium]
MSRTAWIEIRPLLIAALFLLGAVGCRPGGERPPRRDRIVRIVVIGEAEDEPTWAVVQATAAAFVRNNPLTHVVTRAPRTASPSAQQDLLRALEQEEIDAACIHPIDSASLREMIDVLSQRGLPIVVFGRDVHTSKRGSYCGPSDFEIGQKSVEAAIRVLAHRAKSIILLHGGLDLEDRSKRYYGFKQGLSQTTGVTLLREVDCQGDPFTSVRLVRIESRRYPRAGCWVFLDDWPLRALRDDEPLLSLGATFVLCHGSPRYFERLRDGEVQAMIGYDYQKAVSESLLAAMRMVEDRTGGFSPVVDVPVEIVTAEQLPDYEARWKAWQRGEPSPQRQTEPSGK